MVKDVSRLVELHLRFHGYGTGEWTDSAVRRYVRDAGPLLDRLHKLTRSDCTTRNKRKAAALSRAYDDLEERIAQLQEQEELDAIRPDLDGNEIMEMLGVGPGPGGRAGLHIPAGAAAGERADGARRRRRGAQGVVGRAGLRRPSQGRAATACDVSRETSHADWAGRGRRCAARAMFHVKHRRSLR